LAWFPQRNQSATNVFSGALETARPLASRLAGWEIERETGVEIMRTAILWLLGVPVSVLILLNLTGII